MSFTSSIVADANVRKSPGKLAWLIIIPDSNLQEPSEIRPTGAAAAAGFPWQPCREPCGSGSCSVSGGEAVLRRVSVDEGCSTFCSSPPEP